MGNSNSSCISAAATKAPAPPAAAILCLASRQTTAQVDAFCRERGLRLTAVHDVAAALATLTAAAAAGDPFACVVAALGTDDRTRIFDLAGDRSTLISNARALHARVVVYSHTACRIPGFGIACEDAGADAVLCSKAALADAYDDTVAQIQIAQRPSAPSVSTASTLIPTATGNAFTITNDTAVKATLVQAAIKTAASSTSSAAAAMAAESMQVPEAFSASESEYPPVTVRRRFEASVARALALPNLDMQRAFKRFTRPRRRLIKQLASLQRPLCVTAGHSISGKMACPRARVRCVHVSDTHNHHAELQLPAGDCLIHTGDAVGNYGPSHDIVKHFESYMRWLAHAAQKFERVVFVAGNHDTLLDAKCYDATAARRLVAALPKNVTYLENSGATLQFSGARTLKFWGSPCTPSRRESLGKRYYSDAFERTNAFRHKLWETLPGDVDVLLTHVPPTFGEDLRAEPTYGGVSLTSYGDMLLSARLNALASKDIPGTPPRFHCFGHDHGGFGVAQNDSTTFLNGAQEDVVRNDRKAREWASAGGAAAAPALLCGNGCPLVFDA